ncbi:ribosomal protein S18-alanine N-acetyltransferase [Naasia sp. SYSU D00948]|uniref:ribosomal protein S18-alanine N-acetyltransferase n=1 Tax=Naasia sp. SYSU D00948 TaxID=2817379 RepID=UPI001B30A915|nr:ribosomal protein S18-alanine N-acetyltransferase [Naasia sp. SYSU D00948]
METWTLRRASVRDLDPIMDIERTTFPTDAWSSPMMRAELEDRNTYYLVAETEDGRIEGYAGLLAPVGTGDADVQTVAVAEGARRRGLGRRLVVELLREARERGAYRVFLEVRADNPAAQQLYRSLGFEDIGLRRGYYQPDGVDAVVMRRVAARPGECS